MMTRRDKQLCSVVTALAIFFAVLALASIAHPRDLDGKYAASPDREWFKNLTSPKGGLCCDVADGHAIEDPDWEMVTDADRPDLHYRVRLDGEWRDVYDQNVVSQVNRTGKAFVWTVYDHGFLFPRCFMPGNLS